MTAAAPSAPPVGGAEGRATARLVLTAWSAVTPYGVGGAAFGAGVLAGRSALAELGPGPLPGVPGRGGVVPGFSAAEALGRKGTRTMDRVTALAVTAVDRLLTDCGPQLLVRPERVGLVLGTGHGSVQSIMDFTESALTGEKPYHVDPARFPNTVMNRAAGQSAIWHGIKGPNSTVAGGSLTGLHVLGYASRLYRGGHCEQVICGAAEEYSVRRHRLEEAAAAEPRVLGEAAAVALLEAEETTPTTGRRPSARLLGVRFRAHHRPGGAAQALTECVRSALDRAGVAADRVRLLAPLDAETETAAVAAALGAAPSRVLDCRDLLGDTSAASTAVQVAAVLAAADQGVLAPGEVALVTGIDRDGMVGCAVLAG
ncbi:beta-ketoacyl synthase N-terminal-like domain-containing protein [Streptomyces sp. NPDC092296]|uniref:beta-ketoacyl synthase N-terminal-like domain-containing protein n=1 Tax=Streptomyces sp. NPDC092296 TaxID=3366012 RepID=UPI00381DA665